MTDTEVTAFDVAELLRQATEISQAKERVAAQSGAVLAEVKRASAVVNDPSVRFDFAVLERMVEAGTLPRAALANLRPLAEIKDRESDDTRFQELTAAGIRSGQLSAGQLDFMGHRDSRSGNAK